MGKAAGGVISMPSSTPSSPMTVLGDRYAFQTRTVDTCVLTTLPSANAIGVM